MITEEILFTAEVLGYLPEEYVKAAADIIKSQEPDKVKDKINQFFPKFPGITADFLIRNLMMTGSDHVKIALFESEAVTHWVVKNKDRLENMMRAGTWQSHISSISSGA